MTLSPDALIESGGLLAIGAIIFAESGLLIGFFLPGDTLLFTAGFFAAQDKLPLGWLLVIVLLAAIIGYEVGYEIGHRWGRRLFKKKDGIIFRQEYIQKAEAFYETHGGKTVILARFVPIVRTFTSVVAGISAMDRRKYLLYNILGSIPWCVGVTLLGYWLGSQIPSIDKYLLPAVAFAMVLTFGSPLYHILKDKKSRQKLWSLITKKQSKTDTTKTED